MKHPNPFPTNNNISQKVFKPIESIIKLGRGY